jgi:hypothetical protein
VIVPVTLFALKVRRRAALLIGLLTLSWAPAVTAGPPIVKPGLKYDASSKLGLIVVLTEPQRVVPSYVLGIYRFSPAERRWLYGPLKGWSRFEPMGLNREGRRFEMTAVNPPGVYAVNGLTTQGFWRACFNGGTKTFEVKPGVVTFIGLLDPEPTLKQIGNNLPATTASAKVQELFDLPRPSLTPAEDVANWREELTAFLAANYPGVTASIEAPALADATFELSNSIIASQICERY